MGQRVRDKSIKDYLEAENAKLQGKEENNEDEIAKEEEQPLDPNPVAPPPIKQETSVKPTQPPDVGTDKADEVVDKEDVEDVKEEEKVKEQERIREDKIKKMRQNQLTSDLGEG